MALSEKILAVVFGIIGLKRKRSWFAWAGIILVVIGIVLFLAILVWQ